MASCFAAAFTALPTALFGSPLHPPIQRAEGVSAILRSTRLQLDSSLTTAAAPGRRWCTAARRTAPKQRDCLPCELQAKEFRWAYVQALCCTLALTPIPEPREQRRVSQRVARKPTVHGDKRHSSRITSQMYQRLSIVTTPRIVSQHPMPRRPTDS